jgi:hypothetical protein
LTSFLLANCGGGQDKPGCLGPSAKLPRQFLFHRHLNLEFSHSLSRDTVTDWLCPPSRNPAAPRGCSSPRYLSAACTCGQATSAVPLGEDGSSPAETLARSGDTASGEFACEQFACIEKYGGVRFEVWQLARMTESGQR